MRATVLAIVIGAVSSARAEPDVDGVAAFRECFQDIRSSPFMMDLLAMSYNLVGSEKYASPFIEKMGTDCRRMRALKNHWWRLSFNACESEMMDALREAIDKAYDVDPNITEEENIDINRIVYENTRSCRADFLYSRRDDFLDQVKGE